MDGLNSITSAARRKNCQPELNQEYVTGETMQKKHPAADVRLITKTELCRRLAASEASVDRWLRADPGFPQPRRLGPGSIRWVEDEVVRFIRQLTHVAYDDHSFDPTGELAMEDL